MTRALPLLLLAALSAGCFDHNACPGVVATGTFQDLADGCLAFLVIGEVSEDEDRICDITVDRDVPAEFSAFQIALPDTVFVGQRYRSSIDGVSLDPEALFPELVGRGDVEITSLEIAEERHFIGLHLLGVGLQATGGGELDLRGVCEYVG